MAVGKRETGVSWKIGEEIVEEVDEWVDTQLQGNVQLEKMARKGRQKSGLEGWQVEVDEEEGCGSF